MKIRILLLLLMGTIISFGTQAQEVYTKKGVAVDGYDLLSYFEGKPTEGKEQFSHTVAEVRYLFSSAAHRDAFIKEPQKYLPQYGGWCAYAMGESGDLVKINPERYKIIAGKLYLFYDFWGTNTLSLWNEDEGKLLPAADANWARKKN